ncbi:Uncharacterized protein dnl_23460 [Desulfonema limicola]|uniref:Uncharacterized protein n=1 Tax=Desulfonema limicola TaxID=45656 RepID=A0A975B7M6_9BACT|nr:Uncharacterized protein dnl_23460 [Desulfonema limicola]
MYTLQLQKLQSADRLIVKNNNKMEDAYEKVYLAHGNFFDRGIFLCFS